MLVKCVTTSPYHTQYNGLSKKVPLGIVCTAWLEWSYDGDWDTTLHGVLFAYCTLLHFSTKFTPIWAYLCQDSKVPMYANWVAEAIMELASFEWHAIMHMPSCRQVNAIKKWLTSTLTKHKQGKRYNMTSGSNSPEIFDARILWHSGNRKEWKVWQILCAILWAICHCKNWWTRHKYCLIANQEKVTPILSWVPLFDIVHYILHTNLTNIGINWWEVSWISKTTHHITHLPATKSLGLNLLLRLWPLSFAKITTH